MQKSIITSSIFIIVLLSWSDSKAQVGIGTNTPDNSAMLQVQSTEKGFLLPQMSSTQRTSIAAPASGLQVYDSNTNSIWYFNGTFWVNTQAMASVGDVKSGIQANDHSGWVLLDGRAINTLSPNQQAVATSLGLSGNLPNANNAYLVQNGGAMASVSGDNTTTLTQANLPNVTFSGTTASAGEHNHGGATASAGNHNHGGSTSTNGSHNHTGTTTTDGDHSHGNNSGGNNGDYGIIRISPGGNNTAPNGADQTPGEPDVYTRPIALTINSGGAHSHNLNINNNGNHNHTITTDGAHTHSINIDGAHTHTVTVSSGGSATPMNIAPRSLTVNMFIYLGL